MIEDDNDYERLPPYCWDCGDLCDCAAEDHDQFCGGCSICAEQCAVESETPEDAYDGIDGDRSDWWGESDFGDECEPDATGDCQ